MAYLQVLEFHVEREEHVQRVDPALIDWDVQQGCMCERAERSEGKGRGGRKEWLRVIF